MSAGPSAVLVLYDETCGLCVRCRRWLEGQPTWVAVEFLPAGSEQAARLAGHLPLGDELVVLGSDGSAWVGDAAFLVCLWATKQHRRWAERLSRGSGARLARVAIAGLSSGRWLFGAADIADAYSECEGACEQQPPVDRGPP